MASAVEDGLICEVLQVKVCGKYVYRFCFLCRVNVFRALIVLSSVKARMCKDVAHSKA